MNEIEGTDKWGLTVNLLIDEGRIVEQGTLEQLLAASDRYRQLYDLQRIGWRN